MRQRRTENRTRRSLRSCHCRHSISNLRHYSTRRPIGIRRPPALQARMAERVGTRYRETSSGLEGWLCPALFLYFAVAVTIIGRHRVSATMSLFGKHQNGSGCDSPNLPPSPAWPSCRSIVLFPRTIRSDLRQDHRYDRSRSALRGESSLDIPIPTVLSLRCNQTGTAHFLSPQRCPANLS